MERGISDYYLYRIPIATKLANGGGLYGDVFYNQMPIYPYLTALMVLLTGTDNETLLRVAIKFPQIVGDSIIPIFIYKICLVRNHDPYQRWPIRK